MPKITNEQKLQAIKDFLSENGIPYEENRRSKLCGVVIPLSVRKHHIAVRIGDSQEFFERTKGKYYPIFIRDTDTKAKVLEKMQNTIIKSMTRLQGVLSRKANREENGIS